MTKEEKQEKKYLRMTNAKIPGLVMSLAIPMIVSNLVTSIYNMADTWFVGQISEGATSATGAIGVAYGIQLLIQAIGYSFGNGTSNNVSRLLGARKNRQAGEYASTGVLTAVGIGATLALICFLFRYPVCRLLGASKTIEPYAVSYISYILLGAPFMIGSFGLNTLLRGQGNAWMAMIGLITGAAINIGLDPLLIFEAGMGISGAALATCISQMVSFCILLFLNGEGHGNVGIRFSRFRPSREVYKDIFRLGVPSLFRQGVSSIGSIVLNHAALPYGDVAIAAMAIVNKVTQAVYSIMVGFGNGYMPVCNYNYGAKQYRRVRKAYLFSLIVTTGWLVTIATIIFFAAPQVIAFFRADDPEVISIGTFAMRSQCLSMPVLGWFLFCNTTLQGLGYSLKSSFVAVTRQGIVFVPVIYVLTAFLGLTGVQIAQPVSDIISVIIIIPIVIKLLHSLNIPNGAEHIR